MEYSKWKFLFHFFKAIFDTGSGNLRPFFGKWNWFVQMVNVILGWNLPVLNSAYHLSKQWSDQFAHVNSKKLTSGGGPLWLENFYLGQTVAFTFWTEIFLGSTQKKLEGFVWSFLSITGLRSQRQFAPKCSFLASRPLGHCSFRIS